MIFVERERGLYKKDLTSKPGGMIKHFIYIILFGLAAS